MAKGIELTAEEIKNLHGSYLTDAVKEWSNRTINLNVVNHNNIDSDVDHGAFTTNFVAGLKQALESNPTTGGVI